MGAEWKTSEASGLLAPRAGLEPATQRFNSRLLYSQRRARPPDGSSRHGCVTVTARVHARHGVTSRHGGSIKDPRYVTTGTVD
jgi:hypothetical protein